MVLDWTTNCQSLHEQAHTEPSCEGRDQPVSLGPLDIVSACWTKLHGLYLLIEVSECETYEQVLLSLALLASDGLRTLPGQRLVSRWSRLVHRVLVASLGTCQLHFRHHRNDTLIVCGLPALPHDLVHNSGRKHRISPLACLSKGNL